MSGSVAVTTEEAFLFVEDILCMSSSSTKLKDNPFEFVEDLIKAWLHHLPFQTVKKISTPRDLQRVPTVADMKEDMFARLGGVCYQHNVFCFLILRALAFDVSLIACNIGAPSDHAAVLVHNMTNPGSTHYVDVGVGNPFLRAIPFDFKDESPIYHDSFMRYKFSRQDDVIICWTQMEGREAKDENAVDGWSRNITIHYQKGVEVSYFIPSMTPIYTVTDTNNLPFFHFSVRSTAYPHGRFVCIKETTLLIEEEPGHLTKSYFRSRDEIKEAFTRHFPQFPESMLNDAWNGEFVRLDFEKGKN